MAGWAEEIEAGAAPLYERLADALQRAVTAGTLVRGTRLPPHRELAHALGIGVGTVTRAYADAERRGVVEAHVGRGSFVTGGRPQPMPETAMRAEGPLDLAHNLPPSGSMGAALVEALVRLGQHRDLLAATRYSAPEGLETVRHAAAHWIARRHGVDCDASVVVQCNGGQQGMALAFAAMCRPGETILCEASTFHGVKTLAEHAGYRLHGVRLDEGGLDPAALDRAAASTGARVLFTIPTLQNPTTRSMSEARRREIVAVARRRNLMIVEDDAYRIFADAATRPPALAELAPERTIYVASLSKGVSTGLRVCFLAVPDREIRARIVRGVRATGYSPPALTGLVFAQWHADGTADRLSEEIRGECRARVALAQRILGDSMAAPGEAQSPHVWLPMTELLAERVAGRALRAGVEVTPPDAPGVGGDAEAGVRLCLGAVADRTVLEGALRVVLAALGREVDEQAGAVI